MSLRSQAARRRTTDLYEQTSCTSRQTPRRFAKKKTWKVQERATCHEILRSSVYKLGAAGRDENGWLQGESAGKIHVSKNDANEGVRD